MNFYIGNSLDEVDINAENVEFSDELIEFIYKTDNQVKFEMNKLYEINPYDDVEVSKDELQDIIQICNRILDSAVLEGYKDEREGIQMINDLIELGQEALGRDMGLVSIGD